MTRPWTPFPHWGRPLTFSLMTRTAPEGESLLERTSELRIITSRLDAAVAGAGGVLVVEGPAGSGKTRLVDYACTAAAERGLRVLVARASPLEREFGFGIVRDMLTPVLRNPTERSILMQGGARLAGHALDLVDSGAATFAVLHGIYWMIAGMAERQPLLLAVDDVHWADVASMRALLHI